MGAMYCFPSRPAFTGSRTTFRPLEDEMVRVLTLRAPTSLMRVFRRA